MTYVSKQLDPTVREHCESASDIIRWMPADLDPFSPNGDRDDVVELQGHDRRFALSPFGQGPESRQGSRESVSTIAGDVDRRSACDGLSPDRVRAFVCL